MELSGLPYPKMEWDSTNLPDAWEKFERHCKLMFDGPLKGKGGKEQCAYILLRIGDRGRTIHSSWSLTKEENKVPRTIFQKFKDFVQPKANPIFARYKFYHETQNGDSIDKYVARLTISAKDCDFGQERMDEMIRDRIVFGCSEERGRERLIEKGRDLTLETAIQIAQSYEYNKKQTEAMKTQEKDKDMIRSRGAKLRSRRHAGNGNQKDRHRGNGQSGREQERRSNHRTVNQQNKQCNRCGKPKHNTVADCRAMGQTCDKCAKPNHFAKMCRTNTNRNVHLVEDEEENYSSDSDFYVHTVSSFTSRPDNAVVQLSFGPRNIKLNAKIDTGSQVNILPAHLFRHIGLHEPLLAPDAKLTSYTGDQLSVQGKIPMQCAYKNKHANGEFYIVDQINAPALISLKTATKLGLIRLTYAVDRHVPSAENSIISEFGDVFKGIGTFEGTCSVR